MSQVEYDVDEPGNEEEEEEQFVAVEEEPQPDEPPQEEDEDEEETRLGGGREEDDEEDKRARRREENKSRRQRQKEARERTQRELRFLRDRNEDLERRFSRLEQSVDQRVTGTELANIEGQIAKAEGDLTLADRVMEQALEKGDHAKVTEALRHRDSIRDGLRELEAAKDYLSEGGEAAAQQPPNLDPRHVAHAQQFMLANEWWDPESRVGDNGVVFQLDQAVRRDGFNPSTKEYWDELQGRVQQELPHHFDAGGDADDDVDDGEGADKEPESKTRRNKGPQFRAGGQERPLKKNEVYISAERKEAMIEAGVWDDPVLRNRYLKAYATYDNEEGA